MGERRIVHELSRNHATGPAGDDRLRRLVANRDRVAALLRASRRAEAPSAAGAWRSSYAARLWALAEASEPAEAAPALPPSPAAHLTVVDPGDDEGW
jgi:hypothetical protein